MYVEGRGGSRLKKILSGEAHIISHNTRYKICGTCKNVKPLTDYYRDESRINESQLYMFPLNMRGIGI